MDLGVLTKACISRPETCGAAGAAIAFWMRIPHSDELWGGIISSQRSPNSFTYFRIIYNYDSNFFRYVYYPMIKSGNSV